MDSNDIIYQDIDVAKDRAARDEMITKAGVLTVPVIEVDGEIMLGFKEAELRKKLAL